MRKFVSIYMDDEDIRFLDKLELVGSTPIINVSHLSSKPSVKILVKLQSRNRAGSVKDRIAMAMVRATEETGNLQPGSVLLAPSSGNTGIALAMICRL